MPFMHLSSVTDEIFVKNGTCVPTNDEKLAPQVNNNIYLGYSWMLDPNVRTVTENNFQITSPKELTSLPDVGAGMKGGDPNKMNLLTKHKILSKCRNRRKKSTIGDKK
ncbi:hypothetical protein HHI36_012816 [Cryptolaemus montrouzieri]|uniref:Uncharacterized protein n=1 Tax=Cryptolaemus montrouzieri TaxID=559131 RepID=A0ABD2NFK3_9CUCU